MASIHFLIKSKEKGQLTTIYLRFKDGRKTDLILKTSKKIFPEYWSNKTEMIVQRAEQNEVFTNDDKVNLNDYFTQLKDFVLKEHLKLTVPVSKDWLKDVLERFDLWIKKEEPAGKETLNQYIKRFVDEATSGKRLATIRTLKKKYSYGSLRVLRGFMLSFNLFQGIENEGIKPRKGAKVYPKRPYKPLNWNDVSIDTYNDFVQYFYSRGCGPNYVGKHLKSLKTIMRAAREEGLHSNMEIERKAFQTLSEEVEPIYLTETELKALYEVDLSDNKQHQIIRDVFLAGCYTAQRYSDYSKLSKSNIKEIDGKKFIELIQKKTGEKCIVPIRPELETILKRYDYTLPKTFEQKVNVGIKKIGIKAKITELIQVEKNKGGLKVKTSVKKADLICTHTARRTGCTNMYLAGLPILDVMKFSGHKTPKEFLKYIRIGKEETALKHSSHPYFIGNPLSVAK